MIRKLTTALPVALCCAGLLAATMTGSSPASATAAPSGHMPKKVCQIKFEVKGNAGETHADITYDYQFDTGGSNKSLKNVKLPWTLSSPKRACNDGVVADLLANNHADGPGHTYSYIYEDGSLVAESFAYGDDSSASSDYALFS
jgi:hypothetical protein